MYIIKVVSSNGSACVALYQFYDLIGLEYALESTTVLHNVAI